MSDVEHVRARATAGRVRVTLFCSAADADVDLVAHRLRAKVDELTETEPWWAVDQPSPFPVPVPVHRLISLHPSHTSVVTTEPTRGASLLETLGSVGRAFPKGSIMRKHLTLAIAAVTLAGGLPVVFAGAAQAAPTMCDPNSYWNTLTSRSTSLNVDGGDFYVFRNGTGVSQTASIDKSFTASTSATVTTSVGASVSASAGVGWFNAEAGLTAGTENALATSKSFSINVTQNITVPAGKAYMSYAGHSVAKGYITRKKCSSNGQSASTVWAGWVTGPTTKEYGWLDCALTSYC